MQGMLFRYDKEGGVNGGVVFGALQINNILGNRETVKNIWPAY